ncbi:hypothetical protein GCM10027592_36910 [Spirosoma flavus]
MKSCFFFLVIVLITLPAFPQVITSNVYALNQLPNHSGYQEQTLFEGTTRDYSNVMVQHIIFPPNQPSQSPQLLDEETILVVKEGELTVKIGDKHKTLKPGNLVVIMPGDEFQVVNKANQPLSFYQIRYTSNEMPDLDLYSLLGNSYWIDWQGIAPAADHQGRSQRMDGCVSVMSSRLTLQKTTFGSGSKLDSLPNHRAAALLIALNHAVQVQIDGVLKEAKPGDIIFVDSEIPYTLKPSGEEGSTILSIQF